MSVSIQTRRAWSEIDSLMEVLDEKTKNKIPLKLRNFFKEEKDASYVKKIDVTRPISEQNLLSETLAIVAMLNLEYVCEDENEKQALQKIYDENEIKYKNKMKEKYSLSFLNKESPKVMQEETTQEAKTQVVEYQAKGFWGKLIQKIKSLLKH